MGAEWCDIDPPILIDVGPGNKILCRLIISCPTRAEAQAAHKDAVINVSWDDESRTATFTVNRVDSLYRLRLELPRQKVVERAPSDGGVYQPYEEGVISATVPEGD